ncbi:DUF6364 family protein [Kaistella palustris]|uniref:DUF6364 family protein n=1 Tax=Kaistella palustris TaxID=493376 RepID=UPI000426AB5F|nr:DUF6364 family protein [Kaistella palustris]
MNTKLTLNLNKNIIEQAKEYARENEVSLSKLIESYLHSLIKKEANAKKVSPLVQSLTGVIPLSGGESEEEYYAYLNKKYS